MMISRLHYHIKTRSMPREKQQSMLKAKKEISPAWDRTRNLPIYDLTVGRHSQLGHRGFHWWVKVLANAVHEA